MVFMLCSNDMRCDYRNALLQAKTMNLLWQLAFVLLPMCTYRFVWAQVGFFFLIIVILFSFTV